MDPLVVVLVTLAAVLVGAIVPAVVQGMLTLREARRLMRRVAPMVERTVSETQDAARRVNRLAGKAEKEMERTRGFFDAVEGLTQSVQSLRKTAKVSAAVGAAAGPAITAAIRAVMNRHAEDATEESPAHGDVNDASAAAADEVLREFTSKLESRESEDTSDRPQGDDPSRDPKQVPPNPGVHS